MGVCVGVGVCVRLGVGVCPFGCGRVCGCVYMSVENFICPFLQGIGCYMFSISSDEVMNATMSGNEARFINHACEVSM